MMNMEIIILAGGTGKRLRPLTDSIPKCMVPINGVPMLQHHINWLKSYNIKKIVVACGYKWEKIKERYGSSLVYSVEDEPLGTAGAVKMALDHIKGDDFLVLNADDINNVDISKLVRSGSNTTVVSRFKSQFGIVDIVDGKINRFREKPFLPPYLANLGLHLLNRKIDFPEKGSLEMDVLPKIAEKGDLKAYIHDGFWITVNTNKELEEAEKILPDKNKS